MRPSSERSRFLIRKMSIGEKQEKVNAINPDQISQFSDEDLCRIKDFQIGELPKNSGFVRPYRATFIDERNNNPVQRLWDGIDSHVNHSCIFILYNIVHYFIGFCCDHCL